MGEAAAADDPARLRRELGQLNRTLKKQGVFCGLPIIRSDDDFETSTHDSPSMQRVRDIIGVAQKVGAEANAETPEPVVRNEWTILRGTGQFLVRIVEVNPEAPPKERRVRLEKDKIIAPTLERFMFTLKTIATGKHAAILSSEQKAHAKLKEILNDPDRYEQYLLTGSILETGKSGVMYLIRKYRPTIAMREDPAQGTLNLLCALCLHPIGYFKGTWAGALPPTDEVVAHLLLIRADEHLFWKQANHIPIHKPNSGI